MDGYLGNTLHIHQLHAVILVAETFQRNSEMPNISMQNFHGLKCPFEILMFEGYNSSGFSITVIVAVSWISIKFP